MLLPPSVLPILIVLLLFLIVWIYSVGQGVEDNKRLMMTETAALAMRIEWLEEARFVNDETGSVTASWTEDTFEATAYTLEDGTGDGYTATMTRPKEGRTVAVDPQVIPLGSPVWIEDWGWMVAEDTGGAVKGNMVDIFMDSENTAQHWGRRSVKVLYWRGIRD